MRTLETDHVQDVGSHIVNFHRSLVMEPFGAPDHSLQERSEGPKTNIKPSGAKPPNVGMPLGLCNMIANRKLLSAASIAAQIRLASSTKRHPNPKVLAHRRSSVHRTTPHLDSTESTPFTSRCSASPGLYRPFWITSFPTRRFCQRSGCSM